MRCFAAVGDIKIQRFMRTPMVKGGAALGGQAQQLGPDAGVGHGLDEGVTQLGSVAATGTLARSGLVNDGQCESMMFGWRVPWSVISWRSALRAESVRASVSKSILGQCRMPRSLSSSAAMSGRSVTRPSTPKSSIWPMLWRSLTVQASTLRPRLWASRTF